MGRVKFTVIVMVRVRVKVWFRVNVTVSVRFPPDTLLSSA